MESSTLLGFILVVIAGLGTGSCLWPMRVIRQFRFEQCWFIAMLFGLVLIPWGIVLGAIRDPWTAYAAAGGERLLVSNLFAVAWGIANVLAGICALRIGFSLSGSILTGVGLIVSVVVPMIIPRMFAKAPAGTGSEPLHNVPREEPPGKVSRWRVPRRHRASARQPG